MIRINLLPVKAIERRASGQRQLALILAILGAEAAAIVALHLSATADLDRVKGQRDAVKAEVAKLKADVGDYEAVKAQREELIKQRDAIKRLEVGRTGPVFVLRELAEILTKNKGPTYPVQEYEETLRRDPNAGYNPSWDPRRVWITALDEKARMLKIAASAKSNDDVAEFLKRLQLSVFFSDVNLEGSREIQQGGSSNTGKTYTFTVNCKVNY